MKIPKPTDESKQYFRELVPDHPAVEVKPMFGNLGAFVNGNMFMGLFGDDVGVRLAEPGRTELATMEGAGTFGPEERPMAGYVSMPGSWRSTPEKADPWIEAALAHASRLPAKERKPAKKSAK